MYEPKDYNMLIGILHEYKEERGDFLTDGVSIKIQDGDNAFYI